MDTIILHRVTYGKQKTLVKDREYVGSFWGSPVGTKKEWMAWAKANKKKIEFKEKSKKMVFINQEKVKWMEQVTRGAWNISNSLSKDKGGAGWHFISRDNALRFKTALALRNKGRIVKLKKQVQRIHPEYIEDYSGSYETGFGNEDYLRTFTIYTVRMV
jgi:hypothetical protein